MLALAAGATAIVCAGWLASLAGTREAEAIEAVPAPAALETPIASAPSEPTTDVDATELEEAHRSARHAPSSLRRSAPVPPKKKR